MTATATCQNGHQNPEHQHLCGECGVPLTADGPSGQQNAAHQHFCGECGPARGESPRAENTPHYRPYGADLRPEPCRRVWPASTAALIVCEISGHIQVLD